MWIGLIINRADCTGSDAGKHKYTACLPNILELCETTGRALHYDCSSTGFKVKAKSLDAHLTSIKPEHEMKRERTRRRSLTHLVNDCSYQC
jgi:hypothetical protein